MTKQNQLTNERRLSLTATLLQIWQSLFQTKVATFDLQTIVHSTLMTSTEVSP